MKNDPRCNCPLPYQAINPETHEESCPVVDPARAYSNLVVGKKNKNLNFLEALQYMNAASKPLNPFTGQIVLVEDGKLIVDKISGISYVTEKTWDEMKREFPPKPTTGG